MEWKNQSSVLSRIHEGNTGGRPRKKWLNNEEEETRLRIERRLRLGMKDSTSILKQVLTLQRS